MLATHAILIRALPKGVVYVCGASRMSITNSRMVCVWGEGTGTSFKSDCQAGLSALGKGNSGESP